MIQPRLLIFDFDGTLVDSEAGILAAIVQTVREYGFPEAMIEQWRVLIGLPLAEQLRRLLPEAEQGGIPAVVERYRQIYRTTGPIQTQPIPGMGAVLAEAHTAGRLMAIASSKRGSSIQLILERLGWRDYFGAIFSPEGLTHAKPHPESVERALAQFALPREAALLVGDTTFDLETARRGGVRSCAVTWGVHTVAQLAAAQPDCWAEDVDQLRGHIFAKLDPEAGVYTTS